MKMKMAEGLFAVLNNPVIDMSTKHEWLAAARQGMAELDQLQEAGMPSE
jgi:hypothetical protein